MVLRSSGLKPAAPARGSGPVVPVAVLIDVSASMQGEPIVQAAAGLNQFVGNIRADSRLVRMVELGVWTFQSDARCLKSFGPLDDWQPPATLELGAGTSMGAALNVVLDAAEEHGRALNGQAIPVRHRVLAALTDGESNDGRALWTRAAGRLQELEKSGEFTAYLIGIGPHADLAALATLGTKNAPLRLDDVKDFSAFFRFLLGSVRMVSQGRRPEAPPARLA